MRTRHFFLPALALSGAAFLLAPPESSRAFTTIGGDLNVSQRDVRVFNNFLDNAANDNVTQHAQFPGYDGAELAIWKAIVEWGTDPHGDGTGDPLQPVLGDGNANFDSFWCGNATAAGGTNDNIVSVFTGQCSGGVLAFTETPISNGWRIFYCEDWVWSDGPGNIGNNHFCIQGVMAHEYGHALGLGHSVSPATMKPSISTGEEATRSIAADDIAGVQFIYGAEDATKPEIVATVADSGAGTLTIHGSNFDDNLNDVWLTSAAATAPGAEPRVLVLGVASSEGGERIDIAIPAAAGPGDVIVVVGGLNSDISNAFPTDLVGTFGNVPYDLKDKFSYQPDFDDISAQAGPGLTRVDPAMIEALEPGTEQSVTLRGTGLHAVSSIHIGSDLIDPSRYTVVDATQITLDMPQALDLGDHVITVSDGIHSVPIEVTIVPPATPRLQLASGDMQDVVDVDDGFSMLVGGTPGKAHYVFVSLDRAPSSSQFVSLEIGSQFKTLAFAGVVVIPEKGWAEVSVPSSALPAPGLGTTWFAQSIAFEPPRSLPVSNLQSIFLVP
jgi:hypothetical protein